MASYYIRVHKSGSWSLSQEIWNDNERSQKSVPKEAFPTLGIDPTWSVPKAKERVKQINKEKKLEHMQVANAARKSKLIGFIEETFFPEELIKQFTNKVRTDSAGSPSHVLRLFSHFKFVQDMVIKLQLFPHLYGERAGEVYHYLLEHKCSVDYSKKLIQMLNQWGKFHAKSIASFFDELPMPPRKMRTTLAKAQRNKTGVRRTSKRLTLDMLETLRIALEPSKYQWVFVSLWLGLRPNEVDQESKGDLEIIQNKAGLDVLVVNQTKIEGEEEGSGLKYIPLLFEEQKQAVAFLNAGVTRPSSTTLKDIVPGIDTYAGRKGFVDLMQELGQDPRHASQWMGHKDFKTTLEHYKDLGNVSYLEPKARLKVVK